LIKNVIFYQEENRLQVAITPERRNILFHSEGTGKSVYKMKGFSKLTFIICPSSKDSPSIQKYYMQVVCSCMQVVCWTMLSTLQGTTLCS